MAKKTKIKLTPLESGFWLVYNKFKLNFYRRIFSRFEAREASLSAVETFCVEVIGALDNPTINEFAKFVNISQANATYKIQSLIKKGYVTKERSKLDKREWRIAVTEKYHRYNDISADYIKQVMSRMEERFTPEDIDKFSEMLHIMSEELMPETELQSTVNG